MYGRAYYLVRRKWPDMYCVYPHRITTLRDLLKAGYFVAAALYDPLCTALRLPGLRDRVAGFPLLVANNVAWRAGIVRESLSRGGH